MASETTTPPSAAELSQLQQAFSKDPTSEAYYPLAAAYLASERFMEAMVVCKKGAKAFPAKAEPHIMMARIYGAQKKDAKALEEAKQAVERADGNVEALVLLGTLSIKAGDADGGKSYLKKALMLAPEDEDVQKACTANGIELPKPEPVAPPPAAMVPAPAPAPAPQQFPATSIQPVPSQAPQAYPQQASSLPPQQMMPPAMGQSMTPAPQGMVPYASQMPVQAAPTMPPGMAQGYGGAPGYAGYAQPQGRSPQAQAAYEALAARYRNPEDEENEAQNNQGKNFTQLAVLIVVFLVLAGSLAGMFVYRTNKSKRETEIAQLLKKMQDEISHDNYASYKQACEMGEHITTDLDASLFSAHAFQAYAYAIRWGEHGEGDTAKTRAIDHLEKAKKAGQDHSYLSAADAYITFFKGEPDSAINTLEQKITDQDAKGQNSTLLISTLGILQTHAGRLESALVNLKKAQQAAPADSRISAWTGNALRRQGGNDVLAANAYEQALRYEKNHAEAQLGVALMAVDANKPEAAERYINMLLKADPPPSNRQLALARLAHAIILDGKGKKDEADNEEKRALDSDPNNGELYVMKADRQKRAGDMKGAVESIKKAISLDGTRVSFQITLAELLLSQKGSAKEAQETLEKLVSKSPNSIKLLVLLGKAQMELKDFDKAGESLNKAKDKASKSEEKAEIFLELGNLAAWQKRNEEAHKMYAESQKVASTSHAKAEALIRIGHLYVQDGEPRKAIESYAEAQALDSTNADTHFFIGRLLAFNKDVKDVDVAKEELGKYLGKAPTGPHAEKVKKILANLK